MLSTPLTDRLDVDHPVICAGMGGFSVPELAAAVSNAGGLGQVTVTGLTGTMAAERVRRTLELTSRPFAVNVILDTWKGHEIDAALEAGAPAIFLFWGDAAPYADRVHAVGAKLIVQVGSVDEAVAAARAGADAIVAQGIEAGGHVRGTTPLVSLVPRVVEAVAPIPVVAAGGLVDGRGLAAALALGADGVLMGTRFIAAEEAFVHPEYRRRILASTGETVYAADCFDVAWPNAPHRTLRNRVVAAWEAAGRPPMGNRAGEGSIIGRSGAGDRVVEIQRYTSFTATPAFEGDMEEVPLWAGMSVGLVRRVEPAGEIVRETVREAERILAALGGGDPQ
jgi:NAD(P)H-dependent flavin oxidoreductase YrpB (nitropropane dioxygenase family)